MGCSGQEPVAMLRTRFQSTLITRIAIIGERSIIHDWGNRLRIGSRIGSVTSIRIRIRGCAGSRINHDRIARPIIAKITMFTRMLRRSNRVLSTMGYRGDSWGRCPKIARPTRMIVAPSAIASSKSLVMPIDRSCMGWLGKSLRNPSRS